MIRRNVRKHRLSGVSQAEVYPLNTNRKKRQRSLVDEGSAQPKRRPKAPPVFPRPSVINNNNYQTTNTNLIVIPSTKSTSKPLQFRITIGSKIVFVSVERHYTTVKSLANAVYVGLDGKGGERLRVVAAMMKRWVVVMRKGMEVVAIPIVVDRDVQRLCGVEGEGWIGTMEIG